MKLSLFFFLTIIISFSCSNTDDDYKYELTTEQDLKLETLAKKMKDSITIIAHRGASFVEPENTLLAFKKAFDLHADAIELDLFVTADDSIMVFHDFNTLKITGENYNISETKSDVLRKLNIGKGEKIPFLNEVFKILPNGKKVYLEIKWMQHKPSENDKNVENLVDQIVKSNRINDCIIICYDPNYLARFKLKNPNLKCLWISSDRDSKTRIYSTLNKFNFDGILVQKNTVDSELMSYILYRKMSICAFTINDIDEVEALYSMYKINSILTDRPDLIRLSLESFFN